MTMGRNTGQKVWLVTGCASGLGRSFVRAIVARGDIAVATARDPETLRPLQAQHPGQVMPLALDVTRRDQIQQVVDHVIGTLGRIDGLINNAGYGYRAAVEEGARRRWTASSRPTSLVPWPSSRRYSPTCAGSGRGPLSTSPPLRR